MSLEEKRGGERPCELGSRDLSETYTSQGTPASPRSWKVGGRLLPQSLPRECGSFLLPSITLTIPDGHSLSSLSDSLLAQPNHCPHSKDKGRVPLWLSPVGITSDFNLGCHFRWLTCWIWRSHCSTCQALLLLLLTTSSPANSLSPYLPPGRGSPQPLPQPDTGT